MHELHEGLTRIADGASIKAIPASTCLLKKEKYQRINTLYLDEFS